MISCTSPSAPHELRVKRPRLGDVVRSLDDRAAVGEDGELVAFGGEPEHEGVVSDLAQRCEPRGQFGEVQRFGSAGGDLDGVAAAERGRVRAQRAVEPLELAAAGNTDNRPCRAGRRP